jgi:radical SAM protein with 4Fe4S-binding SPASM domain
MISTKKDFMSFKALDILLNSNKIIPHYGDRYRNNKEIPVPISAEFHWTSNCNYDCTHCSYGSRRRTTNYLTNEVIETLVQDLIDIGCKAVYLSGGGEPTIIKKWSVYAEQLISGNIEVALITNGVAIRDKHIDIARKMNYIAVSVYSTIEERYKEITGSKFFDQQFSLPKNIKNGKSNTIVGARCVLNKTNYDELYKIYCAAIEAGFDYIIFIPAVDYEGRGVFLEDKWIEHVQDNIKRMIDKFDHTRTNVKSLLKKKISHYSSNNYLDNISNTGSKLCSAIKIGSGVFFNYDGGVYLCQPDIGNKELEIGNLNDSRFIDIWNSDRHHEIIARLNKRWGNGSCKSCRSIAFNQAIDSHQSNPVNINSIEVDYFL